MSNNYDEAELNMDEELDYRSDAQVIEDLNNTIGLLQYDLVGAKKEIAILRESLVLLKEYAISKGLDLTEIGYQAGQKPLAKKPQDMTKEELRELNKKVTEKYALKHATSKETTAQPTYDDLEKLYEAKGKREVGDVLNNIAKGIVSDEIARLEVEAKAGEAANE